MLSIVLCTCTRTFLVILLHAVQFVCLSVLSAWNALGYVTCVTFSTISHCYSYLSFSVIGHQRCDMLFRTYVSAVAAAKGHAILEGVGLPAEVRDTCFENHPRNVEEAVQSGLIKWRDGGGSSPTWTELLNAMEHAKIGVQHVSKLKEELLKGAVCQLVVLVDSMCPTV